MGERTGGLRTTSAGFGQERPESCLASALLGPEDVAEVGERVGGVVVVAEVL